jgi:hypothetical protein
MQKVSSYLSIPEKTAAENQQYEYFNSRLLQVRAKITEFDLKKH